MNLIVCGYRLFVCSYRAANSISFRVLNAAASVILGELANKGKRKRMCSIQNGCR
jgi:hypothetical protein